MSRRRIGAPGGLVLRTAWLFLGAAIGLATVLLAVSLAIVLDPYVPGDDWTLYPVCLAPFLLLGLLPGVRELEVTAARAMLGVTTELVGSPDGAGHRWRSAAWAVLHLVLGLTGAGALVGVVPGAVWIMLAPLHGEVVDLGGWLVVGPDDGAAPAVLGGLVLGLLAGLVAFALGLLARRLTPAFLGPTAGDRVALAEARLAAEAEHTRLARDLHDGIGHALTIIAVQAAAGRRVLDTDPAAATRSLAAVEGVAREALTELDGMLAVLRDPAERPGPEPGMERLPVLLAAHREAGLAVAAEVEDLLGLPPLVSSTVYRVVAEGLANAQRHAGPGEVRLRLVRRLEGVRIEVESPLSGAARPGVGGRGLVGVRERVSVLGGTVEAGPRDGRWRLRVGLPWPGPGTGAAG